MCKYSEDVQNTERKYTKNAENTENVQRWLNIVLGICVLLCCFQVPAVHAPPVLRPPAYFATPPSSTTSQPTQCVTGARPLPHPPGWMTARWSDWTQWTQWTQWSQWTEWANGERVVRQFHYIRRHLYINCPVHSL